MLGRTIAANEVGPGRPNLIVLTHGLWNRIGANPAIVGRDVRLQGNAYTVVGVLPPTFAFVRMDQNGVGQRVDAYIAPHEPLTGGELARGHLQRRCCARARDVARGGGGCGRRPPGGRSTRAISAAAACLSTPSTSRTMSWRRPAPP